MDCLPVEVIGHILSRLRAARDVVIASTTCRKWLEARRDNLHTISFHWKDWPVYRELTTGELENLITHTILQTAGLECLSICMNSATEVFAAREIAGLREALRCLTCSFSTTPNVVFPCLKSISLSDVGISALDLNLLLAACPKLKSLSLLSPGEEETMQLSSPTLNKIYVSNIGADKFILEADNLLYLHLDDADIQRFELVSKGFLKHLNISSATVTHLDIGGENNQSLEVINVRDSTIKRPSKLLKMISRCRNLRRLRLWCLEFGDDENDEITVDLRTSAASSFPRLSYISLTYDLNRYVSVYYGLQGSSSRLLNVLALELGWRVSNHGFADWVEGLLWRCPNLKKLIIHGTFSEDDVDEELHILATFTSSIVPIMRKYVRVDVQFKYGQLLF